MFKQHHLEDYEVPETADLATLSDQFFKELQSINEKKNSKGKLLWVICEATPPRRMSVYSLLQIMNVVTHLEKADMPL